MRELGALSSALFYIQKARVGSGNRIKNLGERGEKCQTTEEIHVRCRDLEKWIVDEIKPRVRKHPAYDWFSEIKGIGDLNIGRVIGPIDIHKATTISKLWRFSGQGVDPKTGKSDKKIKGKKIKFNPILKTACWNLAESLIRAKGPYYRYYVITKIKEQDKAELCGRMVVPGNKLPINKKTGKREEDRFHISKAHIHQMAFRKMIKLFLSHLWIKWREAEYLPLSMPYAHGILGHSSYMDPDEFMEPWKKARWKNNEQSNPNNKKSKRKSKPGSKETQVLGFVTLPPVKKRALKPRTPEPKASPKN